MPQPPWSAWIPHAGDMRLLDHVQHWDDRTIHAIAGRHSVHAHPLRDAASLHAIHLAEYGAQASAVHGALLASRHAVASLRPGRLVSLRDMQLGAEHIDLSVGPLNVHAECLFADERGAQYAFKVIQRMHELASGRVAVIYTER